MARIIGTTGAAPAAKPARVKVKAHTRAAPAPKPSPTRIARQQEQGYASQGRAVQAQANRATHPAHPNTVQRAHEAEQGYRAQGRAVRRDATGQQYRAAVREIGPAKHSGHGPGHVLGAISPNALVHAIGNVDAGGSMPVFSGIAKVVGRGVKDAEEMAVTTPSSVAHLASTAVHHPEKVPGELAAPYKQLAEHPIKSLSEHPLQTALMVAPAVRMPGRAIGKVARVAGKQTLERPAAELPGTALKVARTGSRDAVVRAVQSHKDAKAGTPTATVKQVQTRVDEFHDMAKHHVQRVVASATNQAVKQAKAKGLSKADRKVAVQEKIDGARGGAHNQTDQKFVREFGAVHEVTPQGHIVKPKGATEGVLHGTEAHAQQVVARLNARPAALRTGSGHDTTPLEFTVKPAGDKFGVVPKVAAERLRKHQVVGTSPATMAKVMRRSRGAFTQAVLPFSAKWLAGQAGEGGLRAAVAGAGPFDLMRFHKVVDEVNKVKPGAGDEMKMRVTGGHFDLTGPAREFANGKSLADEFAGTSLQRPANAITKAGSVAPARAVRRGFTAYTHAVMGTVNGAIEQNARQAMAGQAIKNLGFMDHHLVGLTDAAIKDAADKLQHTENQVAAARAVDRMYGKYQKFSPEMRSLLLHWTPFLPWYLNVASFLTKVLPVDHPVQTALLADINSAEEDWRKSHNLSLLAANHVPDFLLGSVPSGKGGSLRIAHYTPFGVGSDVTGALGSLALPQFEGPILNALGVDWKGDPLTVGGSHGKPFSPTQKAIRAIVTAAEEQIPGVTQAGAISGVTPRYVDRSTPSSIKTPGQVLKGYLPTAATKGGASSGVQPLSNAPASTGRARAVRVKPTAGARGRRVKAVRVKPVRVR